MRCLNCGEELLTEIEEKFGLHKDCIKDYLKNVSELNK